MIRDVFVRFRKGHIRLREALEELSIGKSRFYELYEDYLKACARRKQSTWTPGVSGGNHRAPWNAEIMALLHKWLPQCSYAVVASEIHRRQGLKLDRATIRRWALANGKAPDTAHKRKSSPIRRWQVQQIGGLWQYDTSPHCWLGLADQKEHLFQIVDDHSRLITGVRLYSRETLSSHMDFLSRVFEKQGFPLCLYVDYHSFFWTNKPESLTQLGEALAFYQVSLKYAPTPQAKGKIERSHQTWQNRLPRLFSAEKIVSLDPANDLLQSMCAHHNDHHKHREIQMSPTQAWNLALQENRSVWRPWTPCPWWPYVWSIRSPVRVAPDGRVTLGDQRLRVEASPGTKLIHCSHPNGDFTILKDPPAQKKLPIPLLHCPKSI